MTKEYYIIKGLTQAEYTNQIFLDSVVLPFCVGLFSGAILFFILLLMVSSYD